MNYSQRPQSEQQKLPAGTILPSFVSESTLNTLESHFTGREDKGTRKSGRQRTALLPPRRDLKHARDTCVICSSAFLSSHSNQSSYSVMWQQLFGYGSTYQHPWGCCPVCPAILSAPTLRKHFHESVFAFSLWPSGFPPPLCSSQVLGAVVFPPPPSK